MTGTTSVPPQPIVNVNFTNNIGSVNNIITKICFENKIKLFVSSILSNIYII